MTELLTLSEAAKKLGMCEKLLRYHIAAGNIAYILKGRGVHRKRRMFHPDDLKVFVNAQRRIEACPFTDQVARPSITTTSTSNVVAFTAQLAAEQKQKHGKSRSNERSKPPL
jgi:hypothetical protein